MVPFSFTEKGGKFTLQVYQFEELQLNVGEPGQEGQIWKEPMGEKIRRFHKKIYQTNCTIGLISYAEI